MSMALEEGYQQYLVAVEMAHGQKVDGRRKLDNGKIEVLAANNRFYVLTFRETLLVRISM